MKKINYKEEYIEELNKETFWRLFVDGDKQKVSNNACGNIYGQEIKESLYGHLLWALREPHGLDYLRKTAIKLFSEDLNKEPTLDFLKELNSSAFPAIDHLKLVKDQFAINCEHFFGNIVDPQVIIPKLVKLNKLNEGKEFISLQESPFKTGSYEIAVQSNENIKKIYSNLLEIYNKSEKTIDVIVDFIQDIELLHMFLDGNTRMIYLLLNKELMLNGFNPVILDDPNCFDYKDKDLLVGEIKKGQETFIEFLTTGCPYKNNSLSLEEIKLNIENLEQVVKLSEMLDIRNDFSFSTMKAIAQQWAKLLGDEEIKKYVEHSDEVLLFFSIVEHMLAFNRFYEGKEYNPTIEVMERIYGQKSEIDVKLFDEGFGKIFEIGIIQKLLVEKDVKNLDECIKVGKAYAQEIVRICGALEKSEIDIRDFKNPLTCHLILDELLFPEEILLNGEVFNVSNNGETL